MCSRQQELATTKRRRTLDSFLASRVYFGREEQQRDEKSKMSGMLLVLLSRSALPSSEAEEAVMLCPGELGGG